MKLKYYMRGIGIAMMVTALLVGFSYRNHEKSMTDEDVIARAKQLGMIENNFLSPSSPVSSGQEASGQEVSGQEPPAQVSPGNSGQAEKAPEEPKEPEESKAPEETKSPQTVTLEIVRGDSSNSVSRKLEEAGLVEDAKEYDRYLCENGYDKRISVGTFKIPAGTGEEDIALIITKQKAE